MPQELRLTAGSMSKTGFEPLIHQAASLSGEAFLCQRCFKVGEDKEFFYRDGHIA
jgi:hypothetical protein